MTTSIAPNLVDERLAELKLRVAELRSQITSQQGLFGAGETRSSEEKADLVVGGTAIFDALRPVSGLVNLLFPASAPKLYLDAVKRVFRRDQLGGKVRVDTIEHGLKAVEALASELAFESLLQSSSPIVG